MPPYCPSCEEEFRADIARCADCNVELVATLAQRPQVARQDEADDDDGEEWDEVGLLALDLETAEIIVGKLVAQHIPAYGDEIELDGKRLFRIGVPAEFSGQAALVLKGLKPILKLDFAERDEGVFRHRNAQEQVSAIERKLLGLDASIVVEGGPAALSALIHLIDDAETDDVPAVAERVLAFGEPGMVALIELIATRAAEIPTITTIHSLHVFSYARGRKMPAAFRAIYARESSEHARRDLLRAAGILKDNSICDLLIQALEDPAESVRAEAIDSLWLITGQTHDYEPDAPPAERAVAVAAWKSSAGILPHRQ